MNFNFNDIRTTEFGIGIEAENEQSFVNVTVDINVQKALKEMAEATWDTMQGVEENPSRYEPSEKYASPEHVTLPISDELSSKVRDLHEANNLQTNNDSIDDPDLVFCYFARFTDVQGNRLTAIRRASQFKGVIRKRLIRFMTDAMKLIEDNVFKLDNDFDLLTDSTDIHILRPSGFEYVAKLREAILGSVSQNVTKIQMNLSFVNFDNIQAYACSRPRAARYLASIRSQQLYNIDRGALIQLCSNTGVSIEENNGNISVAESDVMGFLEVLDRRRYEIILVSDSPERFRAPSRQRLGE